MAMLRGPFSWSTPKSLHRSFFEGHRRRPIVKCFTKPLAIQRHSVALAKEGFSSLGIPAHLIDFLKAADITTPTEIQQLGIPAIQTGKSVLLKSPPGTGKTLTWMLPMLAAVDGKLHNPFQALVVVPSREFGNQVISEVRHYLPPKCDHALSPLYMQTDYDVQLAALTERPPCILVATPKAAHSLLLSEHAHPNLRRVSFVVLEEIDQLLAPIKRHATMKEQENRLRHPRPTELLLDALEGLEPDDLGMAQVERQFVGASATVNSLLRALLQQRGWLPGFEVVSAGKAHAVPSAIGHSYRICDSADRIQALAECLMADEPKAALVVLARQANTNAVVDVLKSLDVNAVAAYKALSGKADERQELLDSFEKGLCVPIVAEDMVRGLDFPFLHHAYVVGLAHSPASYLHVAGRTGRMGRQGQVTSLVTQEEEKYLAQQYRFLGIEAAPWAAKHHS